MFFCTYVVEASDLETARQLLEAGLHVRFEPRESSYYGDYYLCLLGSMITAGGAELKLMYNHEPSGEPLTSKVPPQNVILEVADGGEQSLLKERLDRLHVLRVIEMH